MKKLLLPLVLALGAVLTVPGHSQTVNGTATANFDVSVTLTAVCRLGTTPGPLDLSYTSFQTLEATDETPFTVECTNTLPYSMALSSSTATLAGLPVTLTLLTSANAAVPASVTAGTSAASYKVKASIPSGEQGTCAVGTCTDSVQRTLTITY